VKRRMDQIEESVARYLHQLDSADRQEPSRARTMTTERLNSKIETLKDEMQRLQKLEAQMLGRVSRYPLLTLMPDQWRQVAGAVAWSLTMCNLPWIPRTI
jgi:hypothetical protein